MVQLCLENGLDYRNIFNFEMNPNPEKNTEKAIRLKKVEPLIPSVMVSNYRVSQKMSDLDNVYVFLTG